MQLVFSLIPGISLIILLLWLSNKVFKSSIIYPYMWWALAIKVLAGLFIGWLYYQYYGSGDTISFMEDATLLRSFALQDPRAYLGFLWSNDIAPEIIENLTYYTSTPRALFFTKFISLLNLICSDHYWLISVLCSNFSFFGFFFLANQLIQLFPKTRKAALISLLFFPSVVLWTSGVTKESIVLGCITIIIGMFLKEYRRHPNWLHWSNYVIIILLIVLSWKLKYYYTALLLPALLAPWICYRLNNWGWFQVKYNFLIYSIIWLILLGGISLFQVNLNMGYLPEVIKINHDAFVIKSSPGDYIIYESVESNWNSVITNIPNALWSGLARPFFGDTNTLFKWMVALENAILLFLLLFRLKKIPELLSNGKGLFIVSAMVYILVLAIFLSQSTPNFGTLVRYKSGFWFLWVYLILADHPIFAFQLKKNTNG